MGRQTHDDATGNIEQQFRATLAEMAGCGEDSIIVKETGTGDGVVLNRGLAFRHVVALAEQFDDLTEPWVGCYEQTESSHADGGTTTTYNVYIVNTDKHSTDGFERLSDVEY